MNREAKEWTDDEKQLKGIKDHYIYSRSRQKSIYQSSSVCPLARLRLRVLYQMRKNGSESKDMKLLIIANPQRLVAKSPRPLPHDIKTTFKVTCSKWNLRTSKSENIGSCNRAHKPQCGLCAVHAKTWCRVPANEAEIGLPCTLEIINTEWNTLNEIRLRNQEGGFPRGCGMTIVFPGWRYFEREWCTLKRHLS